MIGPTHIFKFSRIVRKLIKRVFAIEFAGFVITIILSFLILWPLLHRQADETTKVLCVQMKNEIESSIVSLETASQYIVSSKNLKSAIHNYNEEPTQENKDLVCLTLNQFRLCQPHIRGLVLEGPNLVQYDSIANLSVFDYSILDQGWHQFAKYYDYSSGFSHIYDDPSTLSRRSLAFSKSYFIDKGKYTLTIYYNVEHMLNNMDTHTRNMFSAYGLADQRGNLFFTHGILDVDRDMLRDMIASQKGMTVAKQGDFLITPIPESMWYLITHVDKWSLNRAFMGYFPVTILLFGVLCLLTFLLTAPAVHKTIMPLNKLAKTMGQISDGKMDAISQIKTGDEIEDLSRVFNEMIRNLKDYIQKQLAHEKREEQMKYSLLVSQIDPHFICNTLSTINFLIHENRPDEVVAINTALMGILQDRLRVERFRIFDTVTQEVNTVKEYLIIQNCRYDNKAKIDWQVGDEAWDLLIPKNIIQPLVENALFHGLMNEKGGEIQGNISIVIRREGEGILIQVWDDGKGIEHEKLKQLNAYTNDEKPESERGKHLGLKNIQERLAYLYQNTDNMKIESKNGTKISIWIPLNPKEQ